MSHSVERPLRVGYVVSYFHPFASGAERQALAQGARARATRPSRPRDHPVGARLPDRRRGISGTLHPSLGPHLGTAARSSRSASSPA